MWLRRLFNDRIRVTVGQSGETLIETLVTLMLLATVVTAFITLATTLTVSTGAHRDTVQASNIATSIAEQLDKVPYAACGSSFAVGQYTGSPEVQSVTTGLSPKWATPAITVEFLGSYQQSPTTGATSAGFGACPPGGDAGVQRFRIRVQTADARASGATVTLVKRNDRCPAGAPTRAGEPC